MSREDIITYARLIQRGKFTIEQVPIEVRDEVQAELNITAIEV